MVTTDRKILDDTIVTTTVETKSRYVDFDDIVQKVEYDDCMSETPWESCDGWKHDVEWFSAWSGNYPSDYIKDARGFGYAEQQYFRITIDDSEVIDQWGNTRRNGEAKQVWLERVARVKRDAIDQLVKWYRDGWQWYVAVAEWGDYSSCVGGIDCDDYAEEVALECAFDVATEMENAGYIVTNRPEPKNHYDRHASFKWKLKHNLQTW